MFRFTLIFSQLTYEHRHSSNWLNHLFRPLVSSVSAQRKFGEISQQVFKSSILFGQWEQFQIKLVGWSIYLINSPSDAYRIKNLLSFTKFSFPLSGLDKIKCIFINLSFHFIINYLFLLLIWLTFVLFL